MNGGLSQDARILRVVDDEYLAALESLSGIDHFLLARSAGQRIAPAEDLQAEECAADEPLPLRFYIAVAVSVAIIIATHLPWATELLEKAAR